MRPVSPIHKAFVIGVFVVTAAYFGYLMWSPGPAELAQQQVDEAYAAVERYREKKGELPPNLEIVVADGELPTRQDNFGYNLVYRKIGDDYEIFSVGPDGMPASNDDIRGGR